MGNADGRGGQQCQDTRDCVCFHGNDGFLTDEEGAAGVRTVSGREILVRREIDGETGEVRLRCLSWEKEAKGKAIDEAWRKRFEEGLEAIAAALSKKGGTKKRDRVAERVGRLKERCRGVGAHCRIDFDLNEKGERAAALRWKFEPKSNGRTLQVRKATRPEPRHREILDIPGLPDNPGGTRKFTA